MVGCSGLRCGARRPRSGPKPRGSSVSLREAVGLFAPEAGDRGERRRDPRAMDDAASRLRSTSATTGASLPRSWPDERSAFAS